MFDSREVELSSHDAAPPARGGTYPVGPGHRYLPGTVPPPSGVSLRDLLAVLKRRRGLIAGCFVATFLGVLLGTYLIGDKYESEFKVLVKHERVDPVVTGEPSSTRIESQTAVSEEEVNSEVALIKSRDLLTEVVKTNKLDAPGTQFWSPWVDGSTPEIRAEKALRRLTANLKVEAVKKSDLIDVTYTSNDAQISAKVLQTLLDLYMAKHVALHKSQGAYDFFLQQADQYRQSLGSAEGQLAQYGKQKGTAAPQVERDLLLQKLSDIQVTHAQTVAAVNSAKQRMASLKTQLATTPLRIQTKNQLTENPQLQEKLKTTLLNLQLKRTELAQKYEPSYLPIRELDAQIAQTQSAIELENKRPLTDNATDQNPLYQLLASELAKVTADLPALEAQAKMSEQTLVDMQKKVMGLSSAGLVEQDLLRNIKTDEQNYLLYTQKREEARISDELDKRRISNVAVVEAPIAPYLPTRSPLLTIAMGTLLCLVFSIGMAFAVDHLDSTLRTKDDVEQFLNIPVLAALPRELAMAGQGHQLVGVRTQPTQD